MGWRDRLSRRNHRPLLPPRGDGRRLARWLIPAEVDARIDEIAIAEAGGHGFDAFGMSRGGIAVGLAVTNVLYEHYFRVTTHGIEHVPAAGPTIVAFNHSGYMPLDGMMVSQNLFREGPRGRAPRVVVDRFVPNLPWVNLLFQRAGAIGGSRGNFHALLDDGGMVVVFPEGAPGLGKGFQKRYQLQPFRPGHAELAIRHQAAIVPGAVVGAEEAWAQILRLDNVRLFGAPYLPIPLTPLPLPLRYHVWYDAPIDVAGRFEPAQADDAQVVAGLAAEVQGRVAALIERGRAERGWNLL